MQGSYRSDCSTEIGECGSRGHVVRSRSLFACSLVVFGWTGILRGLRVGVHMRAGSNLP